MKICTRCRQNKKLSEFNKDNSAKDLLQYWCKQCIKEYSENNKERIRE